MQNEIDGKYQKSYSLMTDNFLTVFKDKNEYFGMGQNEVSKFSVCSTLKALRILYQKKVKFRVG